MDNENQTRPPVAIGHVWLRVTDIPQATKYFVTPGLRLIHQTPTIAVLELRGGTHLVLQPAQLLWCRPQLEVTWHVISWVSTGFRVFGIWR
ncbi:MAG: hypothetical protein HYZ72_10220 [Deltaproteobacteria bacterium]|nr:hypothetical protein [Deltaproteobacteria bacterium]